jgi:hypothetical protein
LSAGRPFLWVQSDGVGSQPTGLNLATNVLVCRQYDTEAVQPAFGSNFNLSNDSTRRRISDAGTRNVSAKSIIVDRDGLFFPRSRKLMYVR